MNQALRNSITALSAHAAAVGPHRRGGKDVALNAFIDDILKMTPEDEKATSEDYQAAWDARQGGNEKKMLALCEMRKTAINNFIRGTSNYEELFFDRVTLGNGDSAEFYNETEQEVAIGYLAQDGKPKLNRAVQAWDHFLVPLKFVSSDKQGYQIEDIQRGDISAAALRTFDIAADLRQQLDRNAYNLMTASLGSGGVFGNFVTTGKENLRTYKAHSAIVTANLPTTNDLVAPNNTSTTKVRLEALREVIRYCDKWGNVFKGGPLRPTGLIIVPSIDGGDMLDQLSATAAKPSAIAEGLLTNYTRFEYGGIVWTVVPDVTIASGTFYVPLSKPVGTSFRKPSMDKEIVKTDMENNWEDRFNKVVQGLYTPVQSRVNACRVQYHS